jgi:hypothetical protein
MLGSTQADPIWILSISRQRQAELIAEVRHDELVQAAERYCSARVVPHTNMWWARFGRLAGLASSTLRQSLRLAPFTQPAAHGG